MAPPGKRGGGPNPHADLPLPAGSTSPGHMPLFSCQISWLFVEKQFLTQCPIASDFFFVDGPARGCFTPPDMELYRKESDEKIRERERE